MKAENMNSLEDLFSYGFSTAPASEPHTGHADPGLLADGKPLKDDRQATTSEVFGPASAVSREKSVTIL